MYLLADLATLLQLQALRGGEGGKYQLKTPQSVFFFFKQSGDCREREGPSGLTGLAGRLL